MAASVIMYTTFGCLLRNSKNPLFLDMIVMRGGHEFQAVLSDLKTNLDKYIKDYQIVLNYGDFVRFYNNTKVQVKLKNASDVHLFREPQPFDASEELEVYIEEDPPAVV
jgi:hypothetical protein